MPQAKTAVSRAPKFSKRSLKSKAYFAAAGAPPESEIFAGRVGAPPELEILVGRVGAPPELEILVGRVGQNRGFWPVGPRNKKCDFCCAGRGVRQIIIGCFIREKDYRAIVAPSTAVPAVSFLSEHKRE
jgi:hypothetical protein